MVAGEDTSWVHGLYVAKPSTNTASEYAVTENVEYDVLPVWKISRVTWVNEVPEDPFSCVQGGMPTCILSEALRTYHRKAIRACRENAVLVRGLFTDMYVPLVTFGEFSGHIYVNTDAGEVRIVVRVHKCGRRCCETCTRKCSDPSTASTDGFMSIALMIPPGPSKPGLNFALPKCPCLGNTEIDVQSTVARRTCPRISLRQDSLNIPYAMIIWKR